MTDRNRLDEIHARFDGHVYSGDAHGATVVYWARRDLEWLLSELAARDEKIANQHTSLSAANKSIRNARTAWDKVAGERDEARRELTERTRELGEAREILAEVRIGRNTWKARAKAADGRVAEVETTLRREREIAMSVRTCLASVRPSKARDALSVLHDGGAIDFGRENVDVARALESALEEIASTDLTEPAGGDDV